MYLVANTKKPHILYQEYGDSTSSVRNYKCFYFQVSNSDHNLVALGIKQLARGNG